MGLNLMKIGSSTDSSIIPNSCVGLIRHGQPFARAEVLGSRISTEDNAIADSPLPNSIGVVLLKAFCEALLYLASIPTACYLITQTQSPASEVL